MKDYSVLEGLDNNFMIELRCAYDRGYRQGRDDEWAETQAKQKENEYERGLNDAWRVITEFLLMGDFDRGMTFNTRFIDELLKLEPQNAVERLKEYNKKQETIVRCCKNCKHSENGMVGNSKRCEVCYYDEVTKANKLFEPMETGSCVEIGDEVRNSTNNHIGIVVKNVDENSVKIISSWGNTGIWELKNCNKTGKCFKDFAERLLSLQDDE